MLIETEVKPATSAQAKEIVNILLQSNKIKNNPDRKITDYFKFLPCSIVFCVLILILCYLELNIKESFLIHSLAGLTLITLIFGVYLYIFTLHLYRNLFKNNKKIKLTIDEEGLDYNEEENKKIKLTWKTIAFVRIFKECICFFNNDYPVMVIFAEIKYAEEILNIINDNKIDVRVICTSQEK